MRVTSEPHPDRSSEKAHEDGNVCQSVLRPSRLVDQLSQKRDVTNDLRPQARRMREKVLPFLVTDPALNQERYGVRQPKRLPAETTDRLFIVRAHRFFGSFRLLRQVHERDDTAPSAADCAHQS